MNYHLILWDRIIKKVKTELRLYLQNNGYRHGYQLQKQEKGLCFPDEMKQSVPKKVKTLIQLPEQRYW